MKEKRIMIKIVTTLILCSIVLGIGNNTYATTSDTKIEEVYQIAEKGTVNPDDYKPSEDKSGDDKITKMGQTIVGMIQTIGTIISVVALVILGVKYMIGSVGEKAEYKKAMIPYIIGAFLLFAGSTMVNILYDMITNDAT